jgi:hypothetical protein
MFQPFKSFRVIRAVMLTVMLRLVLTTASRLQALKRDERGEAVPWLIVLGAGIAIAYFAGDSVLAFAKNLVGQLGE